MRLPTIVLADDHPMFRAGVRQAILDMERYEIIEEVGDGRSAVSAIELLNPDFALLDLSMPGLNGFDVMTSFTTRGDIQTKFLIISMFSSVGYRDRARELGAYAFIAKEDAISELKKALESEDEFFTSQSVGSTDEWLTSPPIDAGDGDLIEKLTKAEKNVLALIADGKTSKEVAKDLGISPRTVDAHRRNCTEKLGIHGRNSLIQVAIRYKQYLQHSEE